MENPLNSLKKFLSNLSKLGSGAGDSAIGIDIGSSSIKVIEIKRKGGKTILETYGSIALGPYDNLDVGRVTNLSVPKVSEALKEVLKQSGIISTSGVFSLPVQSSLIFVVELPASIKESELAQIIPTEARKYIPVPITEVSLNYFILPKKELSFEEMNDPLRHSDISPDIKKKEDGGAVDKTNVLVVAIQNDAISKYRSIVSESSLSASFFEIEIFSSIRANFEHELSPVLLMDFGASRTKLSIVEFGMVRSYHTIDRGGAD
ncbi:hypothetical protein EXS45_00815, partial [Candidatus Nomurabacteria bacterium]|nr:hypothetical protein [Candidatus Nomurabacteria bacterium]